MGNRKKEEKRKSWKKRIALGALAGAGASAFAVRATSNYFLRTAGMRSDRSDGKRKKSEAEREANRPMEKYRDEINAGMEWIREQPAEHVRITSFDGLELAAGLILAPQARGTVILVHGYKATSEFNFSGAAKLYYDNGYNLLLIDQRAHGESEGEYITFGVRESRDVSDWAYFAAQRFGAAHDLFLHGISMGATTVLLASGDELPENVRAIIADCGFTSPQEIISHVLWKTYHLPKFPFVRAIDRVAKRNAGFRLKDADTRRALRYNRRPVLFIHGGVDDFVPASMSIENYKACRAEKRLVIVEDAGHAESYMADQESCRRAIVDFLEKYGSVDKK